MQPLESHRATTTLDLKETSKLTLCSRPQGRQRLLAVVDEDLAAVSAEINDADTPARRCRTSSVCWRETNRDRPPAGPGRATDTEAHLSSATTTVQQPQLRIVAPIAPPVGLQDHAELAARLTTEINYAGATA